MKLVDKEIKNKLEELDVVYFDVAGKTNKKDMMTALNKVEEFTKSYSGEKLLEHIKEIQKSKKSRAL